MSSLICNWVKLKFKVPISASRYCGGVIRDPVHLTMLSLLQRVIRHVIIFRQGVTKTRLNIGKLTYQQQPQQRVRATNTLALTKNVNPDLFQFLIRTVAGTVREVFITNVLRRAKVVTTPTWQRLGGNARPLFGLVGLGLVNGGMMLTEESQFEDVCSEIRNTLRSNKYDPGESVPEIQLEELESELANASIIGQGQCGAIYETKLKGESVAVKVMFNYYLESNSATILRGMMKELVPCKQRIEGVDLGDLKRCSPHPNIVDIKCVLTGTTQKLPGAVKHWPEALPRRMNGNGRNMTMYIVMEKYDTDLETYMQNNDLTLRQRVLILAQMLEGVTHLKRQGIAHRDLKADNFLVKMLDYPHVVITDFGFCLASKRNPLQLMYSSADLTIGGNVALLAPEIVTATPGTLLNKWLSYEHSDTWTIGAIAYEVFGFENPFYANLESGNYSETELPRLHEVPEVMERLVMALLKRNPRERLTSEIAAIICYIFLWGPKNWLRKGNYYVSDVEIMRWLMLLTTKVVSYSSEGSEMDIINTFLQRVSYVEVQKAVRFCQQ